MLPKLLRVKLSDGRGRVKARIWPEGDRTEFKYDLRDNVTELWRKAKTGSGLSDLVIEAAWHANWNKPVWIKDAKGQQTDFLYWESGNGRALLRRATRPAPVGGAARPEYNFTYNNRGQLLTAADPTNLQTAHTYHSSNGNRLTTTQAAGTAMASTTYLPRFAVQSTQTTSCNLRGRRVSCDRDECRKAAKTGEKSPRNRTFSPDPLKSMVTTGSTGARMVACAELP